MPGQKSIYETFLVRTLQVCAQGAEHCCCVQDLRQGNQKCLTGNGILGPIQ
jgi:hypothetical protein